MAERKQFSQTGEAQEYSESLQQAEFLIHGIGRPLRQNEQTQVSVQLGDQIHTQWQIDYLRNLMEQSTYVVTLLGIATPRMKPVGDVSNDKNWKILQQRFPEGTGIVKDLDDGPIKTALMAAGRHNEVVPVWKIEGEDAKVNVAVLANRNLPAKNKETNDQGAVIAIEAIQRQFNAYYGNEQAKIYVTRTFTIAELVHRAAADVHRGWIVQNLSLVKDVMAKQKELCLGSDTNSFVEVIRLQTIIELFEKGKVIAETLEEAIERFVDKMPNSVLLQEDPSMREKVGRLQRQFRQYEQISLQEQNKDIANVITALRMIHKFIHELDNE